MALRLLVADSAAQMQAARDVEARVFMEAFGNTPPLMEREYGPYADRSRFVVVVDDRDGTGVGVVRLVLPDASGELKTLTDVAGAPWHLSVPDSLRAAGLAGRPVVDVATLAVAPEHRRAAAGPEVMLALLHGSYRWSLNSGFEGMVAVLDDHVLAHIQATGTPFTALPGATSQFYLGSPASTPCLCLFAGIVDIVRARRPELLPALDGGVFRTIAVDAADLLPHRGGTAGTTRRPLVAPGNRPGYRPAHRRSRVVEAPTAAAGLVPSTTE